MKNLKKISRKELKQVQGGAIEIGKCRIGFVYKCFSIDVCEPDYGFENCACYCVKI